MDYESQRRNIYNRLLTYGTVRRFQRVGDYRTYDLHLVNGFVKVVSESGETEILTWDTLLYLWLECRNYK